MHFVSPQNNNNSNIKDDHNICNNNNAIMKTADISGELPRYKGDIK